jgi:hypothetical protein
VQIKPLTQSSWKKNIKAQSSVNNEANRTMSVKYSKIWRTLTNFTTGVTMHWQHMIHISLLHLKTISHTEFYFVDKILTSVINKRYVS